MFYCDIDTIEQLKQVGIIDGFSFGALLAIAPAKIVHDVNQEQIDGRLCILKKIESRGKEIVMYSVFYQDSNSIHRGDRVIDPLFHNDENPAIALAKVLLKGIEHNIFRIESGKLIENI